MAEVDEPSHIGAYEVRRRLGEGSFGIVDLGVQARPIRREVAISAAARGGRSRHAGALWRPSVELFGPLDQELIALRLTYLNESKNTYDRIRLRFGVVDSAGRMYGRRHVDS